MTRRYVAAIATAALLAAAHGAVAQDAPVRVDVLIAARSGAVPALDARAFTVTVNGTPREVIGAGPAVPPNQGRTIYLALDQGSVFAGAEASLREVAQAIADRLGPGDRLGLVRLPAAKVVLAPTDDPTAITAALADLAGKRPNDFANFGMGVGEALAIAESDTFALTAVADRDCQPPSQAPLRDTGVMPASRSGASPRRTCIQQIARNVETLVGRARTTGVEAYRGLLELVGAVREEAGPKTVILVTAGLAVAYDAGVFDELAVRAALSDVGVHTVLVEPTASPNTRRLVPASVVSERRSLMRRLTALAGAALGAAHSVIGKADEPLDRLMTGSVRYRLEVRAGATTSADVAARVAVSVAGSGLSAHARPYFVPPASRAPADTPDARLSKALGGTQGLAEPLAVEAAGYLAAIPGETAALLIAGEVRPPADPAAPDATPAVTIGYLLLDAKKRPVVRGPVPPIESPAAAGAAAQARISFAGSVDGLAPGTYVLRVAATDGAGRVGVVEREITLRATGSDAAGAGDVLIGRIEPDRSVTLTPGVVEPADTVFLQWEARAKGAARFRIVQPGAGGATVLTIPAETDASGGGVRATAVIRPGLLPIGELEAIAELTGDAGPTVDRRRAFTVRGAGARGGAAPTAAALGVLVGDVTPLVPRFAADDVLASPLLGRALDALATRTQSDAGKQAIARARMGQRTPPAASLAASDPTAAAFLAGLADLASLPPATADATARALARADLERAAVHFREALRADADFLSAAVFLGVCYAIGGRDLEAAGAWQTALIDLDDDPGLFALIADARLRAGDAPGAADLIDEATKRWAADAGLARRRVVVELARGRVADALAALDTVEAPPADLLFAALRILYGARTAGLAVEDPSRDRARFERYAARYATLGGADQALVKSWESGWK